MDTMDVDMDVDTDIDTNEFDIQDLNEEQKNIFLKIKNNYKNNIRSKIICLGSAGTGKSFLIKKLTEFLKLNEKNHVIISSYQSISTNNINGITLHSLFGIKDELRTSFRVNTDKYTYVIKKNNNGELELTNRYNNRNFVIDKRKIFSHKPKNNWIIIDELSFISIEFLNEINDLLKIVFDTDEIFGGNNIMLCGDIYQLKPVKETPLYDHPNLKEYFIYKFDIFILFEIIRQENKFFSDLCESVKIGKLNSEQKKIISKTNKNVKHR